MSEETQLNLKTASAAAADADGEARKFQQRLLDMIAANIQPRLLAHGKAIAQDNPEQSRELGKERIRAFKEALEKEGELLALDVAEASDRISWPSASLYATLPPHNVYRATDTYIRTKLEPIRQLFVEYGFSEPRDTTTVSAQDLYDEQETIAPMKELLDALHAQKKAHFALEQAQKAHDDATVSDLWGD